MHARFEFCGFVMIISLPAVNNNRHCTVHLINRGKTETRNINTGEVTIIIFDFGVSVPDNVDRSQVGLECNLDDISFITCMIV